MTELMTSQTVLYAVTSIIAHLYSTLNTQMHTFIHFVHIFLRMHTQVRTNCKGSSTTRNCGDSVAHYSASVTSNKNKTKTELEQEQNFVHMLQ